MAPWSRDGAIFAFSINFASPVCLPAGRQADRQTKFIQKQCGVLYATATVDRGPWTTQGFTLVELLIGATILVIGVVAMLGAVVSQVTLNEHARNLSWALNDATRVMERIRQQNSGAGCATPSAAAPTGFASWNVWLADTSAGGGGGKSIRPDPTTNELIVPTTSGTDPLTITVAVCWRHRNRVLGECSQPGGVLTADEGLDVANDTEAVIDSPAMLSTMMTCRK